MENDCTHINKSPEKDMKTTKLISGKPNIDGFFKIPR